jgi:hypothetical protein
MKRISFDVEILPDYVGRDCTQRDATVAYRILLLG